MEKGFIFYKGSKIPFVFKNFCMELFTDEKILLNFLEEYRNKTNFMLKGQCFVTGIEKNDVIFLVKYSIDTSLYLRCYIVINYGSVTDFDIIGFESLFLDDIFKYEYKYLSLIREGVNLAIEPKNIYKIPFNMKDESYELIFRIGYDNRLGLLEDYNRKGEFLIELQNKSIQECYDIMIVLYRLSMFMMSRKDVPFKQINLYKHGNNRDSYIGRLYCPQISEKAVSRRGTSFYKFDVEKYIPQILNNIALDPENKITKSIPLGHLRDSESMFSPNRFLEQVISFEYLFEKLEPQKAKKKKFILKNKLKYMFDQFPEILEKNKLNSEEVSREIKETRRKIVHGYEYYYTFKGDPDMQHLMRLLDILIKKMSLKCVGFTEDQINQCPYFIF